MTPARTSPPCAPPGAGDGEDTYFTLDGTGRITDTAYALYTPAGYRCLNVFVLRRDLLLELVAECASRNGYSLRRNILQEMGARLKLYGYVYDGYAAHINTLQSYYDRSMELLSTAVRQAAVLPRSVPSTARRMTPPPATSTRTAAASTPSSPTAATSGAA